MNEPGIGRTLGPYHLEALLGSGAVGDVYRARDHKLAREVAVKVLHPHLATDPARLQRFRREALAVSALNHPNIVHLYDFGHAGETPYLVMELVAGRTLREMVATGPLPASELLEIALQLAEGLAKAHGEGIVHRDLKPDNVIVSTDGYVKIVDFGLAKLFHERPTPSASDAALATHDGALMGTAAYMSPEQASGGPIDFRSDVFSAGAIFYELATGRPPFGGNSVGETLVAVLRAEPAPIDEVNDATPTDFGRIAGRCLAKRAEDRYATTNDLVRDLRSLRDRTAHLASTSDVEAWAASLPPPLGTRRGWRVAMAAGVVVLTAVAGLLAWWNRPQPEPVPQPGRLRLLASSQNPQVRTRDPALSPDGKMFVYVAEQPGGSDLFVGRVAGGDHVRLTDDAAFEDTPAFSPSGERIAFSRGISGQVPSVVVMPTLGGPVTTVAERATMPAWSPDETHLAFVLEHGEGRSAALGVRPVAGGPLEVHLETDGRLPFLYEPSWSPDGRWLAVQRSSGGVAGEIWLVPLGEGEPRRLDREPPGIFMHQPSFLPDGRALVVVSNRGGATNLWRLPIDGGPPTPLTSGPGPDTLPTVANDGSIAFLNSVWRYTLRTFDLAQQQTRELYSHNAFVWAPTFRPDGKEITFSRAETDGAWHLWSIPATGGDVVQRTSGGQGEVYPRYGPNSLLYNDWNPPRQVWLVSTPEAPATVMVNSPAAYADLSPDGATVAYVVETGPAEQIFVRSVNAGPDEARLLTPSPGTLPRWSPDSRWIAFARDRGMRSGIFVIGADGTGERQLTSEGGWPAWWPDSQRLGYVRGNRGDSQELWVVSLDGTSPQRIEGLSFTGDNHPFDVSPDGRSIVTTDSEHLTDQIWLLVP